MINIDCKLCIEQCEYHKCENCKYYVYESDGGDGHPNEYCIKGHWEGYNIYNFNFERKCNDFRRKKMNEQKLIDLIKSIDEDLWLVDQNQGHFHMRKLGNTYIDVGPKRTILTRNGKSTICVIHKQEHNSDEYNKMFLQISNYFLRNGVKLLEIDLEL